MKKIICITGLFLFLSFATASAESFTLSVTGFTHDYEVDDIILGGTTHSNIAAGEFSLTLNQSETYGYCIELTQSITLNGVYGYELISLGDTYSLLSAAWLINEFSDDIATKSDAAALQLAVWKAIYGAAFEFNENLAGSSETYSAYKAYLRDLPTGFTAEMTSELNAAYDAAANNETQDLLVHNPKPAPRDPVPEPVTILLLGTGLIALSVISKRKLNKN